MSILAQHFDNVGKNLDKAIGSYNKAVGSMETRVLPSIRKFKELGVTGAEEIPLIEKVDHVPRNLSLLDDN
jgi:DNA recombination protein RmuC